jgi:hypothetical protein
MAKKAELVPTEQSDLQFIKDAGAGVLSFWKQATAFFKKADDLEARSREVLDLAKAITAPANGVDDENLQKFIRRIAVGKTTVVAHWDGSDTEPGITKILHRIHRRITARRDVAVKLLDEAATIGNKLHNAYTAEANRRAELERQRLQAIEDQRAQVERDKELAKLERQALLAEETSADLSARELRFVEEYRLDKNAPRAARIAGYKQPDAQALRLIQSPKVIEAIAQLDKADAATKQAAAIRQAPLAATVVDVKADIVKAPGAKDRTTRTCEVFDEQALIAAVIAGHHAIPLDILCIDQVKANQYARDFGKAVVDRWPGARVISDTKVV